MPIQCYNIKKLNVRLTANGNYQKFDDTKVIHRFNK